MTDLAPQTPNRPLIWPEAIDVLRQALSGVDVPLYIIGGAVRDAWLHRPVGDIDLATPGDAIAIARRIANALGGDVFVMDRERGVARVLVSTDEGPVVVDLTRFRGPDLMADLLDRDFTVNAIAVDFWSDGSQIIDPLDGAADLQAKLLRQTRPGAVADDPVRALRAITQSVQFNFRIEPETRRAMRASAAHLRDTSDERVRDVFFKMLSLDRAGAALRVAHHLGLLTVVIPELALLEGQQLEDAPPGGDLWTRTLLSVEKLRTLLTAISPRRTDSTASVFDMAMLVMQLDRYRGPLQAHIDARWPNERPHQALLMLAALLQWLPQVMPADADGQPPLLKVIEPLRLSTAEIKRLMAALAHYQHVYNVDPGSVLSVHRYWHRAGAAGVDACLLSATHYLGYHGPYLQQNDWLSFVECVLALLSAYYDQQDVIVAPPPLLDGTSLITELQLTPGPIVGYLLDRIREAQVTGDVQSADRAVTAGGIWPNRL